jgi:hypothetical protein
LGQAAQSRKGHRVRKPGGRASVGRTTPKETHVKKYVVAAAIAAGLILVAGTALAAPAPA